MTPMTAAQTRLAKELTYAMRDATIGDGCMAMVCVMAALIARSYRGEEAAATEAEALADMLIKTTAGIARGDINVMQLGEAL